MKTVEVFVFWESNCYWLTDSGAWTRSNCLIYIKSGNIVKNSGKNWENYQQNQRNRTSHIQYWHYIRSF